MLVIECKDLHFHKTVGEVAEQLSDFRGQDRSDGKPDHLKRHLDRLEVLAGHELQVAKALNLAAHIQLTGHLVFKNPVPMRFARENMKAKVDFRLFDELGEL